MEKTFFNSEGGNLFELLVSGGGKGKRDFTLELWSKDKNKWVKTGIYFTTDYDTPIETVLEVAKEKVENSIFA